jgi:TonB-dependent SusC/RagA subfamily outer membrane receptor
MMKRFTRIFGLLVMLIPLIIFVSLRNSADADDPRIQKIIHQLSMFMDRCTQQKVYIHTDKDSYLAGETIWMKAYLIRTTSLLPDSISKDIYIELIDFNEQPVRNIILRNMNGFSHGDLTLSDTFPEGKYQIRAYTNWMRNFDKDFFFHKSIMIKNPNYENVITKGRLKDIKRFNRDLRKRETKYNIHFFPEGGYLVAKLPCKVAFKAVSGIGQAVKVSCILSDQKGHEVVSFKSQHEGMGSFEFTPQQKVKYMVKATFENGESEKYTLPQALETGVVMSVYSFANEDLVVNIRSNRSISENVASNEVILVGQAGGVIHYISKGEVRDKPVISKIPKRIFPEGISQLTLFDGRGEPICERLVFIDGQHDHEASLVHFATETIGDSVIGKLRLTSPEGDPVRANLSMVVSEALPEADDYNKETILTNLLLTSDLKGRIADPLYYFNKNNPDASHHLDLVMLTHGWRRFVWKEVLTNRFPATNYPLPGGISISGRITRDFFGIPVSNSKVILSILKTFNDKFETTTDSRGRFEFPMMNYEDTIDVKIEAFKPSGGKGVQIILSDTLVPDIPNESYPLFLNEVFDKQKLKANNRKEKLQFRKKLSEKPKDDEEETGKIHNTPNDVIQVGQDAESYSNILQYMQGKVPGVNISGNRVIIRGVNTIYGSTDPLFLLDGIPIDAGAVSSINPSDIKTIEILKGPEASIYGSRGANGVIAFYSHRGQFMKRGVIEFGMLGYHKAREFYTPDDSITSRDRDAHVPATLYWNPFVLTDSEGNATIRFKRKNSGKKMISTIEGISNSGELIHITSTP